MVASISMVRRIPDTIDLVVLLLTAVFVGHGAMAVSMVSAAPPPPTEAAACCTSDLAEIHAMLTEAEGNLVEIRYLVAAQP